MSIARNEVHDSVIPPGAVDVSFDPNNFDTCHWDNLVDVLTTHYHQPDIQAIRAVLSAVVAHQFECSNPVWPMLIGVPGSMKTELLSGLDGLTKVHLIDEITPNTFISGQLDNAGEQRKQPASLLHRIGNSGVIAFPDFSTVLAMNADKRGAILSQLRRLYDGQFRREFGHTDAEREREWKGRITIVAAVTPDIDRHFGVIQALGERFVGIRWPRPSGPDAAITAAKQNRLEVKRAMREAVHNVMKNCTATEPLISDAALIRLANAAEFIVHARTYVARDGGRDLYYTPEAESGTRLSSQLVQLAKGSAAVGGRSAVNEYDCEIALRAGADCIPSLRRLVLEEIIGVRKTESVLRQTRDRIIEDMEAVGMVKGRALTAEKWKLLRNSGLFGCQ